MLTGRQKIEAALSADGSREMPVVICYESIFVRDHWDELTDCPWWYAHSPDVDHQLAWRRDEIGAVGQDWFELPLGASAEERAHVAVEPDGENAVRVDRRTGERKPIRRPRVSGWAPGGGLHSASPANPPSTAEEVDARIAVPTDDSVPDLRADGRGDLPAVLLDEFGDLYPVRSVSTPLWNCYDLWGFGGMMEAVALCPDMVIRACERFLLRAVRSVRISAAVGARGIWIEDCLTDMISPAAFESLHVPCVRRLVDEIRALGMQSVYYYCGDPRDRWDLLFAVGADALSLEESKKGFTVDIEDVVERATGRCAVFGNLDAIGVLENASENQLIRELRRQLVPGRSAAGAGRFVMSLGSPVTPGTPVARVRRYCELAREIGDSPHEHSV